MWGLIEALFIIALGSKLFPWIVGAIAVAIGIWWMYRASRALDRHLSAANRRRAELLERADQQHAWIMCGDDRGIYGDYIPKQFD
jgi:hypothetical protein